MNHFYLLRANREAGPFTREDLKAHGLLATDLIWVDGESKEWKHASEIEGLEGLAVKKAKPDTVKSAAPAPVPKTVLPVQQTKMAEEIRTNALENESAYPHKVEFFRRDQKQNTSSYTVDTTLFGAVVLLIGLVLCGFVAINMLKQFSTKPAATSQAVEIQTETLPPSEVTHTAQAPETESTLPAATAIDKKDSAAQPPNTEEKPKTILPKRLGAKTKLPDKAINPTQTAEPQETAVTEPVEEKPEPPKPKEKPSLQLSANDYKVGFFGGVSDLQITVTNPSGESVAKAVVEIDFLKPNGNVVRTQTVTAENIAAGGSKTVAVPASGRGVKVRYRVVSVE